MLHIMRLGGKIIICKNETVGEAYKYSKTAIILLAVNYFARTIKGGWMWQMCSNYSSRIHLYTN